MLVWKDNLGREMLAKGSKTVRSNNTTLFICRIELALSTVIALRSLSSAIQEEDDANAYEL